MDAVFTAVQGDLISFFNYMFLEPIERNVYKHFIKLKCCLYLDRTTKDSGEL